MPELAPILADTWQTFQGTHFDSAYTEWVSEVDYALALDPSSPEAITLEADITASDPFMIRFGLSDIAETWSSSWHSNGLDVRLTAQKLSDIGRFLRVGVGRQTDSGEVIVWQTVELPGTESTLSVIFESPPQGSEWTGDLIDDVAIYLSGVPAEGRCDVSIRTLEVVGLYVEAPSFAAPTLTSLGPDGHLVSWSLSTPEGYPQRAAKVEIQRQAVFDLHEGFAPEWDTGWIATAANEIQIPLQAPEQLLIRVVVEIDWPYGVFEVESLTTRYTPSSAAPGPPVLSVAGASNGATVTIAPPTNQLVDDEITHETLVGWSSLGTDTVTTEEDDDARYGVRSMLVVAVSDDLLAGDTKYVIPGGATDVSVIAHVARPVVSDINDTAYVYAAMQFFDGSDVLISTERGESPTLTIGGQT